MTNLRNIANDIYILVFTLLIIFASIIQQDLSLYREKSSISRLFIMSIQALTDSGS